jgi:hypothetical protein
MLSRVFSDTYEYYAPEKGSDHHRMVLNALENTLVRPTVKKKNRHHNFFLHQIAEKMHRRSMIILFTDMFQSDSGDDALFSALQHLKHNKHKVVLFHVDTITELNFDFDNTPRKFIDEVNLFRFCR